MGRVHPRGPGRCQGEGGAAPTAAATRAGGAVSSKHDWTLWRAFLASQDVDPVRLHDARHTAATTLLALGVAPRVVMELLGWSQQAMLQRYQHVLDEMRQDVADRLDAAFTVEAPAPQPTPPAGEQVVSLADFRARQQA
ncbi:tyrosine-type recombinase/integrase [Zhihengliuella sp.]|uniref:tyrosine-type recombinase/integrase n=1 Tax=Zhihengliuella sp. TaxID=1954483 RepID=UPI0028110098|nr:tyrosine-type recombinase/integrase [Zhihengliuella sp.]